MRSIQSKMARAALGWSAQQLADKAEMTRAAVLYFEDHDSARYRTVAKLQRTFEENGLVMIDNGAAGPGVRLRTPIPA